MKPTTDIIGYYEEFWDSVTLEYLGQRECSAPGPDRPLGADGRRDYSELTAPLHLTTNSGKAVVVKAGTSVLSMVYPLCGRTKWKHPLEKK